MSLVAVPTSVSAKRRIPWALATFVALAAVGVVWVATVLTTRATGGAPPGQFYTVGPMDLDITISKDGELQAVNNVEITSPVEGQNVILDIAKEGAFVRKGEIVCRIDSSEIARKLEQAQLDLQKAEADLTAARESKDIQDSTNSANLEAANVELILARLELQQYVEGTYPSDLQNARTNVEMAKIAVKDKEDNLAQTRSLFSKGFVTSVDVKKAELELLTAKNDLDKKTTDLQVLEKYTHEKEVTEKRNKVAQAEKKLARTQRENASSLAQKVAALRQAEQTAELRKQQREHLEEQVAACTIRAPGDGMVVYASSSGGGYGRRDTPIQPGAQVRWQELLIRLPDTSSMKVVSRINEQQVAKLRVDPANPMRAMVEVIGQPNHYRAWVSNISIMADSGSRWYSPDTKDYPVDVTLDHTPPGLKPGMSAQVKIFVNRLNQVLAVPLGAVYTAGRDSYVFARDGRDVKPVKVSIGDVNETHAAVGSGLSSGAQVLLLQAGQGRELLERAGIQVAERPSASTQPFDTEDAPRPPSNGTERGGERGERGERSAEGAETDSPRGEGRPERQRERSSNGDAGASNVSRGDAAREQTEPRGSEVNSSIDAPRPRAAGGPRSRSDRAGAGASTTTE